MSEDERNKNGIAVVSMRSRLTSMIDAGMTTARIAVEAGVKCAALQSWLEARATDEKIDRRLMAWFDDIDGTNADESEPGWVETPTSAEIMAALEYARVNATISLIYGGAGVGKTQTAVQYTASRSFPTEGRAYYVTAARWIRSPAAILQAIAETIQSSLAAYAYRTDTLAKAVLNSLRSGDLIIIDESQNLNADALDGIRYFLDEGRIGICYLGNESVHSRISGKGRRAEFAQLASRVGMRLHIAVPREGDADVLLEAWGVSGRPERQYAQQIACRPGGLRSLVQVLRQARVIARGMKQAVDQRVMRAAADALAIDV